MLDLVYFLLIGLCAGWLAGLLYKRPTFNLVGNLIVGVVGAILGGFLFRLIGLRATSLLGELIMATGGAVALLYGLKYVNAAKGRRS